MINYYKVHRNRTMALIVAVLFLVNSLSGFMGSSKSFAYDPASTPNVSSVNGGQQVIAPASAFFLAGEHLVNVDLVVLKNTIMVTDAQNNSKVVQDVSYDEQKAAIQVLMGEGNALSQGDYVVSGTLVEGIQFNQQFLVNEGTLGGGGSNTTDIAWVSSGVEGMNNLQLDTQFIPAGDIYIQAIKDADPNWIAVFTIAYSDNYGMGIEADKVFDEIGNYTLSVFNNGEQLSIANDGHFTVYPAIQVSNVVKNTDGSIEFELLNPTSNVDYSWVQGDSISVEIFSKETNSPMQSELTTIGNNSLQIRIPSGGAAGQYAIRLFKDTVHIGNAFLDMSETPVGNVSVQGQVLFEDTAEPFTSAEINIFKISVDNWEYMNINPQISGDGTFLINGLADGQYAVEASADLQSDYVLKNTVFINISGTNITIGNGDPNYSVPYDTMNGFKLFVTKAIIKGSILAPDGSLFLQKSIIDVFQEPNSGSNFNNLGSNSGEGYFKIIANGYGEFSISATPFENEAFAQSQQIDMSVNQDGSYVYNNLTYPKGEVLNLNLQLTTTQLKGKVLSSDATSVMGDSNVLVRDSAGIIVAQARPDKSTGIFTIGGLLNGNYSLTAKTYSNGLGDSTPVSITVDGNMITVKGDPYTTAAYIPLVLTDKFQMNGQIHVGQESSGNISIFNQGLTNASIVKFLKQVNGEWVVDSDIEVTATQFYSESYNNKLDVSYYINKYAQPGFKRVEIETNGTKAVIDNEFKVFLPLRLESDQANRNTQIFENGNSFGDNVSDLRVSINQYNSTTMSNVQVTLSGSEITLAPASEGSEGVINFAMPSAIDMTKFFSIDVDQSLEGGFWQKLGWVSYDPYKADWEAKQLESLVFAFDKNDRASTVIQFVTKLENGNLSSVNHLDLSMDGDYGDYTPLAESLEPNLSREVNDIFNTEFFELVEVDATGNVINTIPLNKVGGALRTNSMSPLYFEMDFDMGAIHAGAIYEVRIKNDLANSILADVINAISYNSTDANSTNLHFRLEERANNSGSTIAEKHLRESFAVAPNSTEMGISDEVKSLSGEMLELPISLTDKSVSKVVLYFQGGLATESDLIGIYDASMVKLGENQGSTVAVSQINGMKIFEMTFAQPVTLTGTETLNVSGTAGKDLIQIFNNTFKGTETTPRGTAIVATYDTVGTLIGWKLPRFFNVQLITAPDFVMLPSYDNQGNPWIDSEGNAIPYTDLQGNSTYLVIRNQNGETRPNIPLIYTGFKAGPEGVQRLIIEGVSTSTENGIEKGVPFILTYYNQGGNEEGNFNNQNLRFVDSNEINNFKGSVEALINEWDNAEAIPVNPFATNLVTLYYKDNNGNVVDQVSFNVLPEEGRLPWNNNQLITTGISKSNPVIYLGMENFRGDVSKLSSYVSIWTYNGEVKLTDISALPIVVLNNPDSTEDEFDKVINAIDNEMMRTQYLNGVWKLLKIELDANALEMLSKPIYNNVYMTFNMKYQGFDETFTLHPQFVLDSNAPKLMWAAVDQIVPQEAPQYAGKNVIRAEFDDLLDVTSVSLDKFSLIGRDGQPIAIYGYEVVSNNTMNQQDKRTVLLYTDKVTSRSELKVNPGFKDLYGNTSSKEEKRYIDIWADVKGQVLDENGLPIANANIQLVMLESLFNRTKELYPEFRYIMTDAEGNYQSNLPVGTIRIFNVSYYDAVADKNVNYNPAIEFDNNFKPYGQYNEFNIQLNSKKVSGIVEFPEDQNVNEVLFVETKYANDPRLALLDSWEKSNVFYARAGLDYQQETNSNGVKSVPFNALLSTGSYSVVGKANYPGRPTPPVNPINFTVGETDYTLEMPIVFPQVNVKGLITNLDLGGNAFAVISATGDLEPYTASIFGDASFGLAMGSGSYTLKKVVVENAGQGSIMNSGIYSINTAFEVGTDGNVVNVNPLVVHEGYSLGEISLPTPNLTIKMMRGSEQLNNVGMKLAERNLDGTLGRNFWLNSSSGIFDFKLEPGTYVVQSVWGQSIDFPELNEEIVIVENTDMTGINAYVLDAADFGNVKISVVDAEGVAKTSGWINLEFVDQFTGKGAQISADGIAAFNLDNGIYRLQGYDVNNGWKEAKSIEMFVNGTWVGANQTFEVTSAITKEAPLLLRIVEKSPNVKGIVLKNNVPIADVNINIRKMPAAGELFPTHLWTRSDSEGKFGLFLEEGEYMIDNYNYSIQDGVNWQWFNEEIGLKFYVVNVDGVLKVTYSSTSTNYIDNIELQKTNNVTGLLYRKATVDGQGNIIDPLFYENADDLRMVLRQADISDSVYNNAPWLYEKWVDVDKTTGSFGLMLDAGRSYYVKAVIYNGNWIEFGKTDFEFTAPEPGTTPLNLNIYSKPANFSGIVNDFDGNPIVKGWMGVEAIDGSGFFGIDIINGDFSKPLVEGKQYKIREIVIYNPGNVIDPWKDAKRFNVEKIITVGNTNEYSLIQPNVKLSVELGNLLTITSESQPWEKNVSVGIRTSIPSTSTDYSDYQKNPWKYEKWQWTEVAGTVDEQGNMTNQKAEMYFFLPEGQYMLTGLSTSKGWTQLNETIKLNGSQSESSSNVAVNYNEMTGSYSLTFSAEPNVKGIIKDSSSTVVANSWIGVEKIAENTDPEGLNMNNRHFSATTDGNGVFGLKLELGQYRINGYNTPGSWEGNSWISGTWVQLNYVFTVKADGIYDKDGVSKLDDGQGNNIISIKPNVNGSIFKVFKENETDFAGTKDSDGYAKVKNGWVSIKPSDANGTVNNNDWTDNIWANTGANGDFTLMLTDGYYKVLDAGGMNFWMRVDQLIQVEGGQLVDNPNTASDLVVDGKLVIKPEAPNFKGTMYKDEAKTKPVKWGWMALRPATSEKTDWSQVRWINSDSEGNFEASLSNGTWTLFEMGGNVGTNGNFEWFSKKMGTQIIVVDGTLTTPTPDINGNVDIIPPSSNLKGKLKVKTEEGNEYVKGNSWINIKRADAEDNDWSSYTWIEAKALIEGETSVFETYLEPGTYQVMNVSGQSANNGGWFRYDSDVKFEVGNDNSLTIINGSAVVIEGYLEITPPEPNVIGTAYDKNNLPVNRGWLGIARYDDSGVQVTLEGNPISESEYMWDGIYWSHAKWAEISDLGKFEMNLADGKYKVISVSGWNVWYDPDLTFEVSGGVTPVLTVGQQGTNVKIMISGSAIPASQATEATIDIKYVKDGNTHIMPVALTEVQGDRYIFEATIDVGDYTLVGFNTWNYSNSEWKDLDSDFTVTNTYNESNKLEVEVNLTVNTKKTISGTITGGPQGEKLWVAIGKVENDQVVDKKWMQTDENGNFTVSANSSETLKVLGITSSEGYVEVQVDTTYTVGGEDAHPINWDIDITVLEENAA